MIIDYLDNINKYNFINQKLEKGVKFALGLKDKPVGKYEEEDYFAMVQAGETKIYENSVIETHKKYLDVQILLEGSEVLGYGYSPKLTPITEFDKEKDVIFYSGELNYIKVKENMFYILHETDAHRPCVHLNLNEQTSYKKIVLKLPIN